MLKIEIIWQVDEKKEGYFPLVQFNTYGDHHCMEFSLFR